MNRPRDILPSTWQDFQKLVSSNKLTVLSSRRGQCVRRFLCLCGRRFQGHKRGDHIIISAYVKYGFQRLCK